MKLVASFAALALAACLVGCQNNKTSEAAPGAVNGTNASCEGKTECCKGDKAAAGAVSGSGCCKDKAANTAAPGAVSGSGCCKDKAANTAAPGAVSGKSGCSSGATGCTAK